MLGGDFNDRTWSEEFAGKGGAQRPLCPGGCGGAGGTFGELGLRIWRQGVSKRGALIEGEEEGERKETWAV